MSAVQVWIYLFFSIFKYMFWKRSIISLVISQAIHNAILFTYTYAKTIVCRRHPLTELQVTDSKPSLQQCSCCRALTTQANLYPLFLFSPSAQICASGTLKKPVPPIECPTVCLKALLAEFWQINIKPSYTTDRNIHWY